MATTKKPVSKDTKQDNIMSAIVKIGGVGILLVVLLFMIFGDRSNCGIDKVTLACRWNATFIDWTGLILFLASALWIFGFFPSIPFLDDRTGKQGTRNSLVGFIIAIAGMALIWLN